MQWNIIRRTRPPLRLLILPFVLALVCCTGSGGAVCAADDAPPAAAEAEPVQGEPEADSDGFPPAPPRKVTAVDRPNDAGDGLVVEWELSADDPEAAAEKTGANPPGTQNAGREKPAANPRQVVQYIVERKDLREPEDPENSESGEFRKVGERTVGQNSFTDSGVSQAGRYVYRILAVSRSGGTSAPSEESEPAVPVLQYIDRSKLWFGVLMLLVCGTVVIFIELARSGREMKVRRIAGLEAVDEAVGRATEMGRSCLFVPGILDINDMQTVAGIAVLSRVATSIAEYDAELVVPTSRSLVMTTARETVEAAYLSAGRPDAYREDQIYYLTDEQFGYVAGVTGTMVREKPAACFYMGAFYAESLLLAETGNAIGAIQVAGTAMPSQLPFFVAACDYT
ncbi:MAG: fibronectin type III domain-containing protein, partial [Planctomycetaceae bacterium]|nr:fibronectin type III domain-containing protein [Planctomycetaceae bacterium]